MQSTPPIGDRIQQLTSQLMGVNTTSTDMIFDTRTPPKIKEQTKKHIKKEEIKVENSHPGVAVPVNDEDLIIEESTKKLNFYKIEKPTTDSSGISTWVLLNSQTVSSIATPKPSRKTTTKPKQEENKNATLVDPDLNKNVKPFFKKRPSFGTTKRPTTTSKTTTIADKENKLTKIKASILNNAMNNKNKTTTTITKKATEVTTPLPPKKKTPSTTTAKPTSTTPEINSTLISTSSNSTELNALPLEAKDTEIELATTTQPSKKTRRPSNKRKKNKNRRRKPAAEKSNLNNTKVATKTPQKEKPIGTQLYNYLSREIMPTVGVGLVGLMVTAGLASYFLYPFAAARRSYEVDRKDKEGSYYYDNYGHGVAEEEIIGKVIAGMPGNNNYQNYRQQSSRGVYPNRYHRKVPQASVEKVQHTPTPVYDGESIDTYVPQRNYQPDPYVSQGYNSDIIEHNKESGYTVDDNKQFVVGSIPKEVTEVTPAAVPEHGPRSLRIRKKRSSPTENEIPTGNHPFEFEKTGSSTTDSVITSTTKEPVTTSTVNSTTDTYNPYDPSYFFNMVTNLIELKIRLGLQFLQEKAEAAARYFSHVQRRFDENNKKQTSMSMF